MLLNSVIRACAGTVYYQVAVSTAQQKWGCVLSAACDRISHLFVLCSVSKRYSQFEELHLAVTNEMAGKGVLFCGFANSFAGLNLYVVHGWCLCLCVQHCQRAQSYRPRK